MRVADYIFKNHSLFQDCIIIDFKEIGQGLSLEGGDVFVLDMGEQIKILDIAKKIILLSVLKEKNYDNPDGDIEIVFTGLKKAEKMHEDLFITKNLSNSSIKGIFMANEEYLDLDKITDIILDIKSCYLTNDIKKLDSILSNNFNFNIKV